jgi:hypothetical protein
MPTWTTDGPDNMVRKRLETETVRVRKKGYCRPGPPRSMELLTIASYSTWLRYRGE